MFNLPFAIYPWTAEGHRDARQGLPEFLPSHFTSHLPSFFSQTETSKANKTNTSLCPGLSSKSHLQRVEDPPPTAPHIPGCKYRRLFTTAESGISSDLRRSGYINLAMPYNILFNVDGGCRNNGYSNAIGAAAAVRMVSDGCYIPWTRPIYEGPTSQRAELTAIIIALEEALNEYTGRNRNQELDLTIRADSQYAVNCMTNWIYRWTRNGWVNSAGRPVANRDLIEEAIRLHNQAVALGSVRYEHIPRWENDLADYYCNQTLDEM